MQLLHKGKKKKSQSQALSSLTEPSLPITSSSPAVSVQTLWQWIYTYTHLPPPQLHLSVTDQLRGILFLQMFSPTVGEWKYLHALSEKSIFMTWKNPGHLASQIKFCRIPGYSSLQPIQQRLSWENQDKWDILLKDILEYLHKGTTKTRIRSFLSVQ
jgi:hypothetical protein